MLRTESGCGLMLRTESGCGLMLRFDSLEMLVLWGFCLNKLKVMVFWCCSLDTLEMVVLEVSAWINWKWLCCNVAGHSALTLWRSLKNCSWTLKYHTLAPLIPLVLIRWVHRHPYPIGLYSVCTHADTLILLVSIQWVHRPPYPIGLYPVCTHTHVCAHTHTHTHTNTPSLFLIQLVHRSPYPISVGQVLMHTLMSLVSIQ